MLEALFVKPKAIERARRSWLKDVLDGYLAKLTARRHPKSTLRTYAYRLLCFGEFVEPQGIPQSAQFPEWVEPFVKQLHLPELRARAWRSALTGLIRHLMQEIVRVHGSSPEKNIRRSRALLAEPGNEENPVNDLTPRSFNCIT